MNGSDISTTEEVVQSSNDDKKSMVQKYQRRWERREEFLHWLKPVTKDCYKAFCAVCKAMLKSNLSTLRAHGRGKRHLHAMSTFLCEMSNSLHSSQYSNFISVGTRSKGLKRSIDEESIEYPEPKLKKIVIDCSDGTERTQRTDIPEEIEENSGKSNRNSFSKHRPQKYRDEWENNSEYSPWLRPLFRDPYRAYCLACQVTLKSELVCIKGHAKGLKHQKSMESFKGEEETLLSYPHLQQFINLSPVIQDKIRLTSPSTQFKKYEDPSEELKELLLPSTVLSSCGYSSYMRDGEELLDTATSGEDDRIISKVIEVTSNNFCIDLESFLRRNLNVIHSLRDNSDFVSRDTGFCRLTRMLVGYLAQDYMMDYTMDSWKNGYRDSSDSMNCRLNSIEETIERSVGQMRMIRAELQREDNLDRTLTNFSVERLPISSRDSHSKDVKIECVQDEIIDDTF